jgi:biopolymer transport protein ExbD
LGSNDFNSNSRSDYRSKRKKTNLVLNSLIVIILLLIFFVAYTIFASGNDKTSSNKGNPTTTEKAPQKKDQGKKAPAKQEQSTVDSSQKENQQSNKTTPEKTDDSQAVVTEGGGTANVQKTIENPAWKPVGTSQTGAHTATYSDNSVDWQEMLNAISYATGLEQSNMIVQFLGRDKTTTNGSVGTVYSKDKQQKYKVYISWVDGQGWKPTRVEELSEIQ